MEPKALVLVTQSFPTGAAPEFLEQEINELCERFDQVTIVPTVPLPGTQPVPANVRVDRSLAGSDGRARRLRALLAPAAWPTLVRELRQAGAWRRPRVVPKVALAVGQFRIVADWARQASQPDVAYTFWLGPATAALASAWPDVPVVSRAHRGDLFWEELDPPVVPMQRSAIEATEMVASVSEEGAGYLIRRFPSLSRRITVRRLGTVNHAPLTPRSTDGEVRLMSVSTLTPQKRPVLLAKSIGEFAARSDGTVVHWHHFGDGPMRPALQDSLESAPDNLRVMLHGYTGHDDVLAQLQRGPWDAFINVSSSEGVPVSLMEAKSAGVPLVATAVGGTPELLDADIDQLLDPHPSSIDVAVAIADAVDSPSELRAERRARWAEEFDAQSNYAAFAEELIRTAEARRRTR